MSIRAESFIGDEKIDGIPRIGLGDWIEARFDWVQEHLGDFFDAMSDVIETTVTTISDALTAPAPLLVALGFALLAWLGRDWKLAVGSFLGFVLIIGLAQWENAMVTLALITVATLLALVIGIPIGILSARSDRVSAIMRPVLDLMQTMPAMVWLVPVVTLFSIGQSAALVATVIFAVPPGVRLTELGIRGVDHEVVEAGHAFGAKPGQILREVQLPLALPTVMAGVNQVIMLALSMAVIAGFVGGGGLGGEVITSISRLDIGLGFEAGFAVVILAIYLDRVTATVGQHRSRTSGLRGLGARLAGRSPAAIAEADEATAAPAADLDTGADARV